jgi:hypothetical protein
VVVDGKGDTGFRTKPYFVITLALTDEVGTSVLEQSFNVRRVTGQSRGSAQALRANLILSSQLKGNDSFLKLVLGKHSVGL